MLLKKAIDKSIKPGTKSATCKPATWATHEMKAFTKKTIELLIAPNWPITTAELSADFSCAELINRGAMKEDPSPLKASERRNDQYATVGFSLST